MNNALLYNNNRLYQESAVCIILLLKEERILNSSSGLQINYISSSVSFLLGNSKFSLNPDRSIEIGVYVLQYVQGAIYFISNVPRLVRLKISMRFTNCY